MARWLAGLLADWLTDWLMQWTIELRGNRKVNDLCLRLLRLHGHFVGFEETFALTACANEDYTLFSSFLFALDSPLLIVYFIDKVIWDVGGLHWNVRCPEFKGSRTKLNNSWWLFITVLLFFFKWFFFGKIIKLLWYLQLFCGFCWFYKK